MKQRALPGDAIGIGIGIAPRGPPTKSHRRALPNANVAARDVSPAGGAVGGAFSKPSGPEDDAKKTLRLAFPSASARDARRGDVQQKPPSSFADAEAYRAHFCGALRAEMEETLRRARLDLERVASGVARSAAGEASRPAQRVNAARRGDDRDEAARISRAFRAGAASLGAAYHADCAVRFETFANGTRPSLAGGRRRGGDDDDDDEARRADSSAAAAPVAPPTTKTFLYLNDPDERRGGSSRAGAPRYCKGDLWVLANTARFESASSDGVGDKTKAPFAAAARALWHGPDKDGKMEIQLLCARPGALSGDRRAHRVYAMRAASSSSRALAEHDAFASMTAASFPLLPHVAGTPIVADRVGDVVAEDDGPRTSENAPLSAPSARVVRETHGLNRDQSFAVSAALRATVEAARRVPVGDRTVSPVRLVHGPFGSGKTRASASFVVEAASRLRDLNRPDFRVLLTAHTNVAVDRLCKALLEMGFDDFVRVGALRKMDPAVLSRSLHVAASGSRNGADENEPVLGRGGRPLRGKGADHARELRAMLRDATNARERAALARELRETQEGKADARARALGKCRVVAATAASCANECLRDSTFALVVLDEASQITEPAFVAAVAPFGCETLVAVGDPKQLGPVVENDGSLERNEANDEESRKVSAARSRSLFARLAEAGHAPTLLRAQYRCHPALSAVANACFYGGALEDGVAARDRAPLLCVARATLNENENVASLATPMPPLVWADVATSTGPSRDVAYDKSRSAFSLREARVAALVVNRLVTLGICPSEIGVVTLFRAHARAVERALDALVETSVDGDGTKTPSAPPLRDVRVASEGPLSEKPPPLASLRSTQVSTVDAFQGQEKEVIVLSLCGGGGGAFASDERLNVALTRAKRHLIVLGDSRDPASKSAEAWRLCLRTARRAPCGFVDAGSVRSEAATRAWLAGWRRNDEAPIAGRDRDREPDPPSLRRDEDARAEETFTRDEKSDGDENNSDHDDDDDDDDDDDASLASPSPSPDPFDPIVLSGDEDTLFVPAGSPLSRSPLSRRVFGKETAAAKRRVASGSASPLAKKKKKALLQVEPRAGEELLSSPREKKTKRRRESLDAEPAARCASPDPDLDSLPPARLLFHDALRGVSFGPEQYWRAYCDLHRGALYGDKSARARVECSRLGAVLATHFGLDLGARDGVKSSWDSSSTRRVVTSAVLPGMATFVHATHGHRWTRLRNLIEAFDDAETLAKDPAGFGAHVLEDARTQEEDEAGASAFADGNAT